MPFNKVTAILLVLCVWMIYVTDRLLDGRRLTGNEVTKRHGFHAKHHRSFKAGLALALLAAAILTTTMTDRRLITFGAVMVGLTGIYGLLVHRKIIWAPKEFLCGGMFSAGVVGSLFIAPFPSTLTLLFGFLCSGNCLVIACAEASIDQRQDTGALPQRWPGISRWVTLGLILLTVLALGQQEPLSMAMAIASVGLIFVHLAAQSLDWKRAVADVCLLSPLLTLPWL